MREAIAQGYDVDYQGTPVIVPVTDDDNNDDGSSVEPPARREHA